MEGPLSSVESQLRRGRGAARPWTTVEQLETVHGVLELRQRGERDFLILIDGRILMNASESRSEIALGKLAGCVADRPRPRVLIGGLGMAITLRAALESLPQDALVLVAEIEPAVEAWCRGPLASLTDGAVFDSRVSVEVGDVADVIDCAAERTYDCIVLDLFEGPAERTGSADRLFGRAGLAAARRALATDGVYAVWSEKPGSAFERRLARAGFKFECRRPGRGGLRHAVYLARARADA